MSTKPSLFIRSLRYIHALLGTVLFLFLLLIITNTFILTSYVVQGHSMEATLHNGEYLGVFLLSYVHSSPKIGDVVVLTYAGNSDVRFVKRVEGLPGDTVEVQGIPTVLQADQYFVEGDNRDHSTDSRVYGPVKGEQIIGKVIIKFNK